MIDLHKLIDGMPKEQREGALLVLDAISSPLSSRDLERALRKMPMTHSRAASLARVLGRFHIIAVVDREHAQAEGT